jgi:salicylate hydroxylase
VRSFGRLGDSLGLGQNAFDLLVKWGCDVDEIRRIGNQAPDMTIRRWGDGRVLAVQPLMDMAGFIGHRGDYHDVFLGWVKARGIEIRMGSEVVEFEEEAGVGQAAVTLQSGERLQADVVVAADGIKSLARPRVLGSMDQPVSSGYACFRAFFRPSDEQRQDRALNSYLRDGDCVNFWIGPDLHLVQNTLRGGAEFNWILTHKDEGDVPESWFQEGDMGEVRRLVQTLDPEIRGMVEATERCLDWKICYREPLASWVSPKSHRIVLLGDSCHAHLPTSAQGASQAVESAGCLAVCLNKIHGKGEVRVATRAYEKMRFPRTRASQTNGEDLRDRWHGALKGVEENIPIDPESVKIRNRWLYAFDAEEDARERWDEVRGTVEDEFASGGIKPLC